MWATLDLETDAELLVVATTDPAGKARVAMTCGADLAIRLNVSEAVDLATALTEALAEIAEQEQARELHRDEDSVRAAAEIRESL